MPIYAELEDFAAIERDRETEGLVRRIVSNPELAEIAYPSREIRENILPLIIESRVRVEKLRAHRVLTQRANVEPL